MLAVAVLLVSMAISGTVAAYDNLTQTSSDAGGVPSPLGDYGDRSAPPVDEFITSTEVTATGSSYISYMLCDNWGGNWADAEKVPQDDGAGNTPPDNLGDEDDELCWAATGSNMMEWTGWGFVSTFDNTDDIFHDFQDHWTDYGYYIEGGLQWWFDGTNPGPGGVPTVDVPGSGDFWDPPYAYATYSTTYSGSDTLQYIDSYLRNGMVIGLGITGHAITCWGFEYDPAVDKAADPVNYYKGVWVTDSDDNKNLSNPPDVLRDFPVSYHDGMWHLDRFGTEYQIDVVTGLAPFPDDTRPVANTGGTYVGSEGSAITFDGSASSDADGNALQYRWDFDNNRVWDTAWSSSPTASFTWDDDYSGAVVLEVFDGRLRDVDTATVTVNNVAPAITVVGDTINEDGTATVSGTITDPGSPDTFTVVIDWGEGSPQTYNYPAGSTSYTETHQYLDDNPTGTPSDNYTVVVTVTDDDMGLDTESGTVVVNNVAPVVSEPYIADQPNSEFILPVVHEVEFQGIFSDVGTLDTHTAVWDWGDGLTSTGVVSESGGSGTASGSHTYSLPGDYTVTLTVTDDDTDYHSNVINIHVADVDEALDIFNQYIQDLDGSSFKGKAALRKNAFNNEFLALQDMWLDQEYSGMIGDLVNNVRAKADGLIDGKAGDDWIRSATAQDEICQKVDDIVQYLEYLLGT